MYALKSKEMNRIDSYMINDIGIPSDVLINESAYRILEVLAKENKLDRNFSYAFLVGKGNNGADVLALARVMLTSGYRLEVIKFHEDEGLSEENKRAMEILVKYGVEIYNYKDDEFLAKLVYNVYDVYVDGILGTGFRGSIEEKFTEAFKKINDNHEKGKYILGVDVPSGVSGDTLNVAEISKKLYLKADAVVALGLLKYVHILIKEFSKIYLGDITFSKEIVNNIINKENALEYYQIRELKAMLPKRNIYSNKATFGNIAVIGGSANYDGAVRLSAMAALKSGAGLVTVFSDNDKYQSVDYELMNYSLDDMHKLGIEILNPYSVVVLGCGLKFESMSKIDLNTLKNYKGIIIIDGGAIEFIKSDAFRKSLLENEIIITPHVKELARLLDVSVIDIKNNPLKYVAETYHIYGVIVVLKDYVTYVYNGENSIFVSNYGNNGLSTAGSGDTLTGIIAGLVNDFSDDISLGVKFAVCIHGMTAMFNNKNSKRSFVASDIINNIENVFSFLDGYENRIELIEKMEIDTLDEKSCS